MEEGLTERKTKDTKMASSSSNENVAVEAGEEYPYTYPYPSNLSATSFISVKLSGRDEYIMWKTQMLCLLKSHGMFGFIDGTLTISPQTSSTSVSGKEKLGGDDHNHWLWTRSDALVKDYLCSYYPSTTTSTIGCYLYKQQEEQRRAEIHHELYEATLSTDWGRVDRILSGGVITVTDKITKNGNTALYVAVGGTNKPEFLERLLEVTPNINTQLLDMQNSDGSTLLHVAAIVGNNEAVDILVERNSDLLLAKDSEGRTPLALALSNMNTQTARHLLEHINNTDDIQKDALFSGTTGDELLVTVISSKDFRLANDLVKSYKIFHSDAVLTAIAQNFPPELNKVEKYIAFDVRSITVKGMLNYMVPRSILSWVVRLMAIIFCLAYPRMIGFVILYLMTLKILGWIIIKERVRNHCAAEELSKTVSRLIKNSNDPSSYHHYYTNPILEATRQNACKVVQDIVSFFPNAIWSTNEDGHNILQYAVINRSIKVYKLLHKKSEHKNMYRNIKDSSGNNLLHLAARLAPDNKLNFISGAALQIQRELKWFKEVEGFVCPLNIKQKNSFNETPQMVFTREHKELVIEGEKWMKATAHSYTITAALITTVVFAAAITVPGGNDNMGIPNFTNKTAFIVFAVSDAISLVASLISLFMFLSILTA
ncbi:unnamed protein product [Lactuca virosa]|uniref:PGG domain-containing protein n=1 Tax=Lactuca virosa TaxID=75947 RepID=A0AAU9PNW1_9ASTR|nr:unnamed protein product [Lactuca virosa]